MLGGTIICAPRNQSNYFFEQSQSHIYFSCELYMHTVFVLYFVHVNCINKYICIYTCLYCVFYMWIVYAHCVCIVFCICELYKYIYIYIYTLICIVFCICELYMHTVFVLYFVHVNCINKYICIYTCLYCIFYMWILYAHCVCIVFCTCELYK